MSINDNHLRPRMSRPYLSSAAPPTQSRTISFNVCGVALCVSSKGVMSSWCVTAANLETPCFLQRLGLQSEGFSCERDDSALNLLRMLRPDGAAVVLPMTSGDNEGLFSSRSAFDPMHSCIGLKTRPRACPHIVTRDVQHAPVSYHLVAQFPQNFTPRRTSPQKCANLLTDLPFSVWTGTTPTRALVSMLKGCWLKCRKTTHGWQRREGLPTQCAWPSKPKTPYFAKSRFSKVFCDGTKKVQGFPTPQICSKKVQASCSANAPSSTATKATKPPSNSHQTSSSSFSPSSPPSKPSKPLRSPHPTASRHHLAPVVCGQVRHTDGLLAAEDALKGSLPRCIPDHRRTRG